MKNLKLATFALAGLILAGCDQSPVSGTSGNDQTTANTQSNTVNQQKTLSQSKRETVTAQINAQSIIRDELEALLPDPYDEASHPTLLCSIADNWGTDPDNMAPTLKDAIKAKAQGNLDAPIFQYLLTLREDKVNAACLASQVRTASIPMTGWDRSVNPFNPEANQRRAQFMTVFANNARIAADWYDYIVAQVEAANATNLGEIRNVVRLTMLRSAEEYYQKLSKMNESGFTDFQLNISGSQREPVSFYADQYLYEHGPDGARLTSPKGVVLFGPDTIDGQQVAFNYTRDQGAAMARGSNSDRTSSSTSSSTTAANAGVK